MKAFHTHYENDKEFKQQAKLRSQKKFKEFDIDFQNKIDLGKLQNSPFKIPKILDEKRFIRRRSKTLSEIKLNKKFFKKKKIQKPSVDKRKNKLNPRKSLEITAKKRNSLIVPFQDLKKISNKGNNSLSRSFLSGGGNETKKVKFTSELSLNKPKSSESDDFSPEHSAILVKKFDTNFRANSVNLVKVPNLIEETQFENEKNHISFTRKQSSLKNDVKKYTRRKNIIEPDYSIGIFSSNLNLRRLSNNDKNLLKFKTDFSKKAKKNWNRIRILVHAIQWIIFLNKEIILFGVTTKSKKAMSFESKILDSKIEFTNCVNRTTLVEIHHNIPKYIIDPNSTFYNYWVKLQFVILLYFTIIYPFRISLLYHTYMVPKDSLFIIDLIVELLFFLDIIINFFLGYEDESRLMITDFKSIFNNYLNSWMIFDFISIIPFYIIVDINNQYEDSYVSLLFLLKFLRILKFGKTINHYKATNWLHEYFHIRASSIKLIYFFLNSTLLCYTFASIWNFTPRISVSKESHIYRYSLINDPVYLIFIKSIYFGYTVFITIGYGDIVPFTTIEIVIVLVWMFICALFYTFTLTSLSSIFLESNARNLKIHNKCNVIEEVFSSSKLKHLIFKTTQYLKRNEGTNENYSLKDIQNLISELPLNVKLEVSKSMFNGCYNSIGFFNQCSQNFFANIIPILQISYHTKNSIVYEIDDIPEKLYFISQGSIEFANDYGIIWQNLVNGTYFGDIEILKKTFRNSTTQTKEYSVLLSLTKSIVTNYLYLHFRDDFNILFKNMLKRNKFYKETLTIIERITEEGRLLFNKEIGKLIKIDMKYLFNGVNSKKYYFRIGLSERMKFYQIKRKNSLTENNFKVQDISSSQPRETENNHNTESFIIKSGVWQIQKTCDSTNTNTFPQKVNDEINMKTGYKQRKSKEIISPKDLAVSLAKCSRENEEIIRIVKELIEKVDIVLENNKNIIIEESEDYSSNTSSSDISLISREERLFRRLKTLNG